MHDVVQALWSEEVTTTRGRSGLSYRRTAIAACPGSCLLTVKIRRPERFPEKNRSTQWIDPGISRVGSPEDGATVGGAVPSRGEKESSHLRVPASLDDELDSVYLLDLVILDFFFFSLCQIGATDPLTEHQS